MQGRKIILEKRPFDFLIPKEHFLRQVNNILDFSFIYMLTKPYYSLNTGRPSVDPTLYFRIQLLAYLYNISSERRICREMKYNLLYRWFCGLKFQDKIPHHSSLTKIRNRFGVDIFLNIFEHIIRLCIDKGLVNGDTVHTDSTLIKANASIDSLVKKSSEINTKKLSKTHLSNKTHISKTDPDATLARKSGTEQSLKYKVHDTIDSNSRVVLDSYVTTGAVHDSQVYLDRIAHIESRFNLKIKNVVADRAYGSGQILLAINKIGFNPFIPFFHKSCGQIEEEKHGFTYNKEQDYYVCPAGKILTPICCHSKDGKRYRSSRKVCKLCPLKMTCIGEKRRGKSIFRNIFHEVYENHFEIVNSSEFAEKLKERFWKIEGINSEAKNLHSLKEAHFRSRPKVQIQAYLVAWVQNIKRLVNYMKNLSMPPNIFQHATI